MKKFIYLGLVGLVVLWMSNLAIAMMCDMGSKGEAIAQPAAEEVVNADNKICPVSGEHIKEGEAIKFEYEGKAYNLCCKMCEKDFKKDPKKYIEKIEAQEAKEAAEHKGQGHEGHAH